ncbi:MAG TPA: PAS domain S-box protein [Chthoniobacteraceae bacterium]|jgi:PAS domain S-box-containing protein
MSIQKIQVLLVEDNPTDQLLVEDELAHATSAEFSVVHVEQLNEALTQIATQHFDVVLLDLSLPDSHGFETFVRLHEASADIPIVVLSGGGEGQLGVQAVQAGAQDYLVKGRLGENVLPRSIRYAIERQRSERTLAESEERYRQLIQQSPDGYVVHCQGLIVFANAAALKMYGAGSAAELLGQAYLDRISPECRDRVQNVGAHEGSVPIEVTCLRLDGSTISVEGTSNPFSHEGRPAVQVVLHDLTERKLAEEHRKLLETCVARLHDIVIITKAQPPGSQGARIIFVNDAFTQRTGYTREEVLGRSPRFLEGPKTSRSELDRIDAALRQWQPVHAELINYTKSGEEFWVELDIVPVADAAGTFTHWVAVERDITERKRVRDRFRRLVDCNAQGVMFWNIKGEITGANDAFLDLVGYRRDQLAAGAINWIALTPPEYAEADRRALEELTARGVCKPYEKEFIHQDGARVPLLVGMATFEDSPEEGLCFTVDLTERKKLEQQFLRTQRMESIGTLAGGIAHDLNNSLGPIILSLDLLSMKFTDPDSQELLAIVASSARRGADMVRQVLSFARGVEGRRMEVQIKHLLREIEKIVTDTFAKNIQMRLIIPQDLWTVRGDPTQLQQVLLNLCVNARDAMPGGGTLTISAENLHLDAHFAALSVNREAPPGPYVYLQVRDTGTGIAPAIIEKIFDPFFTTKELGKGTGLGLSTSMAIVRSHGGFLRAYSEPGKGTTFRIYLPAETEVSASVAEELAAEMPRGNGELILVVDDEVAVRQITQQTLETFGYRVVLARDGAEAVEIYARQGAEIALVLTDMMMPVMDGPATIEVLRRMNPAVRIIGASGLPSQDQLSQKADAELKEFLSKPYTAEVLLKAVRNALAEPS